MPHKQKCEEMHSIISQKEFTTHVLGLRSPATLQELPMDFF